MEVMGLGDNIIFMQELYCYELYVGLDGEEVDCWMVFGLQLYLFKLVCMCNSEGGGMDGGMIGFGGGGCFYVQYDVLVWLFGVVVDGCIVYVVGGGCVLL